MRLYMCACERCGKEVPATLAGYAKMVLRNSDLGESGYAVPGDIFSTPDHVLYVDKAIQDRFHHNDPTHTDVYLEALSAMVERRTGFKM